MTNSSRFNEMIFKTFSEAYSVYLKTALEFSKDLPELEKHVRSKISDIFNLGMKILLADCQILLRAILR